MKIKILELYGNDNAVTGARYLASLDDVQSEGNWYFDPMPLSSVTEDSVAYAIIQATTADGVNSIEARLQEQLANQVRSVRPPWVPETFTVSV